ncbi:FAD/NAD(P)-binding protein [Streptosporangium sp. NPDC049376]|uniref:FAD/NAD(P)-binding protein n=1 Tax=Streptosporangium sp. NPDC049376 TaxID=3366192 RepID=UPI00378FAFC7
MNVPEHRIAVVGAGPLGTYAMAQLAAVLSEAEPAVPVRVSVFERSGRFGAGAVHSDEQARTSYLNRSVGQIGFAADESSGPGTALLPRELRPTFHQWCRRRYAETGDPVFDVRPDDVPRRYVHGLALRDMFDRYVRHLRNVPGVTVDLHPVDVLDVTPHGSDAYVIRCGGSVSVVADRILFVTGHQVDRVNPSPGVASPRVAYPYPLDDRLSERVAPPGRPLAVSGLGLTAVDVILHLTEGRGGRFVAEKPGLTAPLRYLRSGREPSVVIGFSPSGVPVTGRPVNDKINGWGPEHRGRFLTVEAVRRLRAAVAAGRRAALDFDRHLMPLVALETAYVYHATLLGPEFAECLATAVTPLVDRYLSGTGPWGVAGVAHLLGPVDRCFQAAVDLLDGRPPCGPCVLPSRAVLTAAFHRVVHDGLGRVPPSADGSSPWRHSARLADHRFDHQALLDPLRAAPSSGTGWHEQVLRFLRRDIRDSAQGNVRNPVKAACDGVWRDLRVVFNAVADRGGLRPAAHQEFLRRHMRYYNRLSNGAGLEPMRKILALAECGVLDLSTGPEPVVSGVHDGWRITGGRTGTALHADLLVDAWIPPFDPDNDPLPLYRNLLRSGLVRQWCDVGDGTEERYVPGALDLDPGFHPVRADGTVDPRLTFLGAPAEGLEHFQLTAARPYADSAVLANAARWATEAVAPAVDRDAYPAGVA